MVAHMWQLKAAPEALKMALYRATRWICKTWILERSTLFHCFMNWSQTGCHSAHTNWDYVSLHALLWLFPWSADIQLIFLSFFLVPNSVSNLRCEYYSGGYGLVVIWDRLHGVVDVVQVGVNKKNFNQSQNLEPEQKVTGLQPAQWYKVTATSFSGAMKSQTVSVNCQTNPAGKGMSRYL